MTRSFRIFLASLLAAPLLSAQAPGDQEWRFAAAAEIIAAPSQGSDGTLYVGSEDYQLYAVNPDGSLKWSFSAGDYIQSATAIDNEGNLYFGSWDGFLYSLTPSGTLRWKYDLGAFITASPAIGPNGQILIGANDGIFYAFSPSGQVLWYKLTEGPIVASAAVGTDGTAYFGNSAGRFYAIDASGQQRWTFSAEAVTGRDSRIKCAPVIAPDGTVYFGSGNHYLYALNRDGALRWKYEAGDAIDSAPVLGTDGSVVFGCRDGYVYKLNQAGLLQWFTLVGDVFYASPAIDNAGNTYIVGFQGQGISRLFTIAPDGVVLWTKDFTELNDSSPLLTADGYLYVGMYNGGLYKLYTGAAQANSAWPQFGAGPLRQSSATPRVLPDAPQLQVAINAGGMIHLSLPTVANLNYRLERLSLSTGWTTVASFTGDGTAYVYQTAVPGDTVGVYWRVVIVTP